MRIGLISDVHWIAHPPAPSAGWHGQGDFAGTLERARRALSYFNREHVDIVAVSGDLAHNGDFESLSAVLSACHDAIAPVVIAVGNHDVSVTTDALAQATERAGAPGATLASVAGTVIDGVRVAGVHVGETDGWFRPRLRALPDPDTWGTETVVLVSHYPVLSLATIVSDAGLAYPGDLLDRSELEAALAARPEPTIVIGGHVHARATRTDGAILQLTVGALVEAPYECAVIDVGHSQSGEPTVRRQNIRLLDSSATREPLFSPAKETWRLLDGRWTQHDSPSDAEAEIREIVDRETRAWDQQDVELLLSVFHPDMVWPWPPNSTAHDPIDWQWGMGRFDRLRWRREWERLFAGNTLIHNRRTIRRIEMSPDGDGAFAVVDVDTLWRNTADGSESHWLGRACKVYTTVRGEWKMSMHTGLLTYEPPEGPVESLTAATPRSSPR
jgi:predicted phosphodiesterase